MYEGGNKMVDEKIDIDKILFTNQPVGEAKWKYDDLEKIVLETRATSDDGLMANNIAESQAKLFADNVVYNWNLGPTEPDMVANGKDEVLRIALGAELGGIEGWKYPMVDYWIDPQQAICVWKTVMQSPWPVWPDDVKRPYEYYTCRTWGYSYHFFDDEGKATRKYDEWEVPTIFWTHAEGVALDVASPVMKDKYAMRLKRIEGALRRRKEYLDDLCEEYGWSSPKRTLYDIYLEDIDEYNALTGK
jgi:hypothetical protein